MREFNDWADPIFAVPEKARVSPWPWLALAVLVVGICAALLRPHAQPVPVYAMPKPTTPSKMTPHDDELASLPVAPAAPIKHRSHDPLEERQ